MPRIEAVTRFDFDEIVKVWEASVRATHDFLSEADILAYRSMFPACLFSVDLYGLRDRGRITGFLGVAGHKVEMLFIHPDYRRKGLGKMLMAFATEELNVNRVDVNEENTAAAEFYFHLGFEVTGRSVVDGLSKPHPLLHLALRHR
ncbi:MAG TPA: GNAT family N-acetyltransferase [Sphingobacteriaceae bacterium]